MIIDYALCVTCYVAAEIADSGDKQSTAGIGISGAPAEVYVYCRCKFLWSPD